MSFGEEVQPQLAELQVELGQFSNGVGCSEASTRLNMARNTPSIALMGCSDMLNLGESHPRLGERENHRVSSPRLFLVYCERRDGPLVLLH